MSRRADGGPGIESPPSELRRVVAAIRSKFERSSRDGGLPAIEPTLEGLSPLERPAVLRELVALEVELRLGRGDRPTLREYVERFPADAPAVADAFGRPGGPADDGPDAGPADRTMTWASGGSPSSQPTTGVLSTALPSDAETATDDGPPPGPAPDRLGRYRVVGRLGEGSFGRVYLAHDDELGRGVAIKVPKPKALVRSGRLEALMAEARLAAGLSHPAIVRVLDVGRLDDGAAFIVMEHVPGRPLSDLLRRGVEPPRLAELAAHVADGLHHAHRAGLVHRDLKPANILIDERGMPRVTDFGLALTEADQADHAGEVAGAPSYMAPEQVRGEAHRLDGRTDVWAIGVILYQGLTGRLPFAGRDRSALFDEILHREPRPPAQVRDGLPRELVRICLKCLEKRMAGRYASALDLADDLRRWLAESGPSAGGGNGVEPARARVAPRGLRSFDGDDADGFLALLPGPRGRDGLPESIRFWKSRIEARDDRPFGVGLLYGPSGAGKSSLVKAGLLPRLSPSVRPVLVEASPTATEARALVALRRAFPGLPEADGLAEVLARLRQGEAAGPGSKILLVFDQFEQWLQAHPNEPEAPLVAALRQCDGRSLQAILLVRDDFWMAVARLFKAIEVPLVEGGNSGPVEPFDEAHARAVLAEFGRACGRLPAPPEAPGAGADEFLRLAAAGLAGPDGCITPVHLCLLVEVVRRRPWVPETLRDLGGIAGIGVTFLAEAFDAPTSPPCYRMHRDAAEAVLEALLPAASSRIRGAPRPSADLRRAAGYGERPGDFDELIRILESELRLVSTVDPGLDDGPSGEPSYQLAHDFLVSPIRQWVDRKRRATREGRARIRLATIAASWAERPSRHRLPTSLEWAGIVLYTRASSWSADERRMMRAASRTLLLRAAGALAVVAAILVTAWVVRDRERARAAFGKALQADARGLVALLPELDRYRDRLRDDFERLERDPAADADDREAAALLLFLDDPTDARASGLRDRLRDAGPDEVALIRTALARHPDRAGLAELRMAVGDERREPASRLRAACALAGLGPIADALGDGGLAAAGLARALLEEDRRTVPSWVGLLGPDAARLAPALGRACGDADLDPGRRSTAAEILADLLASRRDAGPLAHWALGAQPEASLILLRALDRLPDPIPAVALLRERYGAEASPSPGDEALDRRAMAAVALALLGRPEALADALRHRADPGLRSRTVWAIARRGLAPRLLAGDFLRPDRDPAVLQAALMAWAETPPSVVPSVAEAEVAAVADGLFSDHPDPGVHAAAGLLLRRWGRDLPDPSPPASRAGATAGGRGWLVGPNGHTFAVLPGPAEFPMGSPPTDPDRFHYEARHRRRIDRSLAVATAEVTVEQFRAAFPGYQPDPRYVREPGCPAGGVNWFDAARYCNWLSREEGLPPEQWCYPEAIDAGTTLAPDAFDRPGYRLPTEAEWEYFCRAGTATRRPFGDPPSLLDRYARTWLNSGGLSGPATQFLPNAFGLFDTLGSQWEWCHDGPPGPFGAVEFGLYPAYPAPDGDRAAPDHVSEMPPDRNSWRIVRGGVFDGSPALARSGHRDVFRAEAVRYMIGFRVVRTLPAGAEGR